jgi:hypothetical protein
MLQDACPAQAEERDADDGDADDHDHPDRVCFEAQERHHRLLPRLPDTPNHWRQLLVEVSAPEAKDAVKTTGASIKNT